ncbi:HCL206Cp [Eremothecium sinecaudum]|uniref:HCL206Cp n=1 Tax=Eremothecium sinecaudum TaxID=45286 RepID=A0A0X8HR70_9SACH|nr:HCL206Cp [Eremothecium sinecaudum]AMD19945.1 HCL206Cp [Eremothecium sinecaudum]
MELEQEINKVLKSRTPTKVADIQLEIETNQAHINHVQLKKLREIHDEMFQEQCYLPAKRLYEKYNEKLLPYSGLQSWAERIDRDIRVIEATIEMVNEGRRNAD